MKGAGEGSTLALGTRRLGFPCWKKLPQQWVSALESYISSPGWRQNSWQVLRMKWQQLEAGAEPSTPAVKPHSFLLVHRLEKSPNLPLHSYPAH